MHRNTTPRSFTAEGGATVYAFRTSRGAEVLLDEVGLQRLRNLGATLSFNLMPNKGRAAAAACTKFYVRTRVGALKRSAVAARIVAGAAPGQVARYRDGDPTNLRSDNLYLTEGRKRAFCLTEVLE